MESLPAAPQVEIELTSALRERLTVILKDLLLETEKQEEPARPPTVINGYLPPKRSKPGSEFPFVIVRPSKGITGDDGYTRCTVKILIGCFSEEFDGYEYAMQVLARIRAGLMQNKRLAERFTLETPFSWELYDEQPYPQWELELMTEWILPTPQETAYEGDI